MGPVRPYAVTVNGHRTIMNLSERDARMYPGAVPVGEAPAEPPAKARAGADKSRRPRNK